MAAWLIIGGGFLGAAVAKAAGGAGHDVVVFSHSFAPPLSGLSGESRHRNITLVTESVRRSEHLAALIDRADVVLYFAGRSTPAAAGSDPAGSVELSVVPATTVLELMSAGRARRLVLASSGGTVYGEPRSHPTAEDHPADPISLHGHNVLTIERYASFFAHRNGLEPVILRIATAYGPGQRSRRGLGVISAWIEAVLEKRPVTIYGDPNTRRDFVFVDDVVRAVILAASDARTGIYNVGSGTSHSLAEVLGLLRELNGAEFRVERHAARGVDVRHTELDCSRLAAEVNWQAAITLTEGLRLTWEWWLARADQRD